MDWGAAIAGVTAEMRAAGRAESTIRLRRSQLRQFAAAKSGRGELLHPDPLLVDRAALIAWVGRPGLSPEYRKSVRSSLIAVFGWLDEQQLLRAPSPAAKLPAIHVPGGVPRPADDEVIVAALAKADARQLLMLRLAAELGLRRAEIASADVRRIELAGLRILGKGSKTRVVPLPRELRAVLTSLPPWWVFPSPAGGHLTAGHVGVLMSRVLPVGITPHQLRHAAATAWHDAGLDIADIQPLLGHARLDTTARYVLTRSPKARAAVEAAAGRLQPRQRRRAV